LWCNTNIFSQCDQDQRMRSQNMTKQFNKECQKY
jgi:hypothetical protein